MRHLCVLPQLFCLVAFSVYQVLGDGATFCTDKEAGVYPDPQSNCTKFYICEAIAEHSTHWSCLDGTNFDTKTCDCQATDTGSDSVCDPTEKCNISTKASALGNGSKDPEPTTPKKEVLLNATRSVSCSGKATGLYPNAETGCQKYYACVKGVDHVYDYTCPKFFVFDHRKCMCLPAHLALCQDTSTPCFPAPPPPRPTTTLPPPPPPSDFCRGKGPGYYTDVNRGCEWYFVCHGGNFQTYQFQCPSHLRFNHFTCNCDYPYAAPCTIFNEVPCFQPSSKLRAML